MNEQYILQQENSASSMSHFEEILRQEKKFRPYGEKLSELKKGERIFELYKPTMMNPGFKEVFLYIKYRIFENLYGSRESKIKKSQSFLLFFTPH